MNDPDFNPDNAGLSRLLRDSRVAPPLPPRFQESVWRRIEQSEAAGASGSGVVWLDAVAVWLVRPRLAFALAAVLVLAGAGFGLRDGAKVARDEAQSRYLSSVAPGILR